MFEYTTIPISPKITVDHIGDEGTDIEMIRTVFQNRQNDLPKPMLLPKENIMLE
jgi:hypothetical protein